MNVQIVSPNKEIATLAFPESDLFLFEMERFDELRESWFEVRNVKNEVLVELMHRWDDGSLRLLANVANDLADILDANITV